VGLFILTCVIIAFSDGLLSLFILDGVSSPGGWALFLAVLTYAGLELIIYLKKHFRSGVDDALLFMVACQFVTAFAFILFSEKEDFLVLSLVIFVVTLTGL
jgi:hypothetical protein